MKKWIRTSISFLLVLAMIVSTPVFVHAETPGGTVDITQGLLAHYDFENVEGTQVANKVTSNTDTTATLSGGAAVTDLNGTNPLGSFPALSARQRCRGHISRSVG